MVLIVIGLLCLAIVPLTGGDLRRLATLRMRWLYLAPLGVLVQTVLTIAPSGNHALHAAVYALTYVPILVFLLGNRRVRGVPIIALGTLLNALVIVFNGGVMPAAVTAQRLAGLTQGRGFQNSAALAHPHLLWLGDIIPVPWPLPNVLSIGDCVIYSGLLVLLYRGCRVPRLAPTPSQSRA